MRFALLLALMLNLLNAEPREALLIGNYKYNKIPKLNNPSYNLDELKTTLEKIGFRVKIVSNLDSIHLEESIEVFAKRLAQDRSTIGFLYYTGHGCQVEREGYLIPIDINSADRLKVKHHALKISEMIERLKGSGNSVNMLFLDACREVPVGSKGSSKGLGQITNTPKGTLVVYATEEGQLADDNSDFINSLIGSIKEPKQTIRDLPYSISDIFSKKNTNQTPIFSAVGVPKVVLNSGGGYGGGDGDNHPMKGITKLNGLMYQNQPFSNQDKRNYDNNKNGGRVWDWQGAKDYCEALTLGNYTDWRLPSRSELKKLLTKTKQKNSKGFEYCIKEEFVENMPPLTGKYESASFWSSTERDSSSAWDVGFYYGNDSWNSKSNHYYALCVR